MSVHRRPSSAPAPNGLVQEQHEDAGDGVHDDAGPYGERAIQDEECAADHRGDHPTSDVKFKLGYSGMKGAAYIRDSADAMPHAVPRTLVANISGVQLGKVRYSIIEP